MGFHLSAEDLSTGNQYPLSRYRVCAFSALLALTTVALSGCGPKRIRADFVGFESAYAETSNRETLLNLARLANHDPTYFFKIGQISSQYNMQASLTGNASYALQSTNISAGGATGGGTPVVSFQNTPSFTFIPVDDQINAQLLLQPIPSETFYALYQEGWRIDQLFRLMVDRIELSLPVKGGCEVLTYRNAPPPVYTYRSGQVVDLARDADTISRYVTFLRISAILYALQKHGDLLLTGTSPFVPYDTKSGLMDPASAVTHQQTSENPKEGVGNGKPITPAAGDVINAHEKGSVWEQNNGTWLLGEKTPNAIFYLNHYKTPAGATVAGPDLQQIQQDIESDPDLRDSSVDSKALEALIQQVLGNLQNGFSITGTPRNPQQQGIGPCPAADTSADNASSGSPSSPTPATPASRLVLRSLLGVMAAAAQEQIPFELLRSTVVSQNARIPVTTVTLLGKEVQNQLTYNQAIPPVERQPLLILTGKREDSTPPLIEISYGGNRYFIADPKVASPEAPENEYWNRDVFRLVTQLSSQVTVDISKFPLPAILQLNAQ